MPQNQNQLLPRVAIVYLSFHSERYIKRAAQAWGTIDYPKDRLHIVIVDNLHPVFGNSTSFITEHILPLSNNESPEITYLEQSKNSGYAGGNNCGIRWAVEHGFDYVFIHNDDGFVDPYFLKPLVEALEKDKNIGVVQPLILQYPETKKINTSGNKTHYLGFGFCSNINVEKDLITLPKKIEPSYGSGAALLLRCDLLKKHGLIDEDLYLYHEDLEYSYRLRSLGYKIVCVTNSFFYHEYSFKKSTHKMYYMERNRFAFLLMYYKFPSLLLLMPMLIFFEAGLLGFSILDGWFKEKMQSYRYWLNASHWRLWLGKRNLIQSQRIIPDKILFESLVGSVVFNEGGIDNPAVRYIANPLCKAYWWLVKKVIVW